MKSTFKPTLLMTCGQALAFVGTFFVPVILARLFDQAEYGTYKQLFLIYLTLHAIAQFGMAESLFYFLPRNPGQGGRYVANSLLFLAVAGVTGLWFLWAAGPLLSAWLGNPALSEHMTVIGLFLWLTMVSAPLEIVMIARKRYLGAAVSYGVSDLLRAACLIVPALVQRSLEWVLLGAVAFAGMRLTVVLAYVGREFGGCFRADLTVLKAQLAYAVPFGAAVLVHVIYTTFHQYAVSYYFDPAAFAIYSVGCLSIPLVDFVVVPASNVMMVRMSDQMRESAGEGILAIWHDTTRKVSLLLVPLLGLLLVTARELIVLLFTVTYLPSVPIFMVWSTSILWSALNTDGVLRVYADTRFLLAQSAVRLAVNVTLMYWSIRTLGLVGAVLVTALATVLAKGLCLLRIRALMAVQFRQLLPWRSLGGIALAAAAAGLPALALKQWLDVWPVPRLLATGLVYSVVYMALLLRLGALSDVEKRALSEWIRRAILRAAVTVPDARTTT